MAFSPRDKQRGSTILEFAIVAPCLIMMFFGTIGLGLMMGRYIQAIVVNRDVAHMYSDGIDFSQTTPQNIIINQLALGTGITATGGNGVIIFSQIITPYASDCTAAGVSPCTNQGLPVFSQRLYIGNTSLRSSQFGTPTSTLMDSQGNISASVYLSNSDPSVRTSGFEAQLDTAQIAAGGSGTPPAQAQGNTAYVVEVYFQYPSIAFLGYGSPGGAYSCYIFN